MERVRKESFVAEITERLSRAPVVYLTDFTGLEVKHMTRLRRSLRESGAEYVVVKNRLALKAFDEMGLPDLSSSFQGPTGLVFGYGDAAAAAKAVSDFASENDQRPVFKFGIMDRQVLQPQQIERIAKLPPREQLLAELAGVLQAPIANLAGALSAKLQETAGLLDALKEKREAAG